MLYFWFIPRLIAVIFLLGMLFLRLLGSMRSGHRKQGRVLKD